MIYRLDYGVYNPSKKKLIAALLVLFLIISAPAVAALNNNDSSTLPATILSEEGIMHNTLYSPEITPSMDSTDDSQVLMNENIINESGQHLIWHEDSLAP